MAITLIGHQPIDFTYKENDPCENLSDMCLQYEVADNPMFQIKVTGTSGPIVTIEGTGSTVFTETVIPYTLISVSGDFWTFTLNFTTLGIASGCYILCVYDTGSSGTNLIANGTFTSDLTSWTVAEAVIVDIASYTDTTVTLTASGGTGPYTYSSDGTTYQASTLFSGLTAGNTYTFYAKDSNNVVDSTSYTLQDCSVFAGSEAFDVLSLQAAEVKGCEAASFI